MDGTIRLLSDDTATATATQNLLGYFSADNPR